MTDEEKERNQNARTAYQVAATLYMQENGVTWARFNAMVATNGIVVAATGLTAGSAKLYMLALFLPVFGILLCGIWCVMMWRGFAYLDVWRDSAYRIEREFLASATQTLFMGDQLSRCRRATIEVKDRGSNPTHRAPPGKARIYASIIILLFGILYFVALAQVNAIAPGGMHAIVDNAVSALRNGGR